MLQKNNKSRLLKLFFQHPTTDFQLRQLSRLSNIAPPSTKKYLQELEAERVITKSQKGIYPTYRAARDTTGFKNLKKWSLSLELTTNGLVEHIADRCCPDTIILFGSASRGEDIETSDIDIVIIAEETKLDLKKYEKTLCRNISPLFAPNFNKLSTELKNNILNGIILYGYVKVF